MTDETDRTAPAAPNRLDTIIDVKELRDTFREDVVGGLSARDKAIPPKHLYDARGSELFERICEVKDYYPTRTEAAIYDERMDEIARAIGPGAVVIEPGAGSGEKAARLLAALDRPSVFVPIEISRAALDASADRIAAEFPGTVVVPICADFTDHVEPHGEVPEEGRVVYFPGSTVGNFEPGPRARLLRSMRELAGDSGKLLIGIDLEKDPGVLERAYDDSEGVTAEFNRNLLERINRELDADFDPDAFRYQARWDEPARRVEMGVVSDREQTVRAAGRAFSFREGERLHTENSYKFTRASIERELGDAGFRPLAGWTDRRGWFFVGLFGAA